jgi:hypothetical protein
MKKIGQKKPHLPSHMREGGVGGFFNISVNQIGHLEEGQKTKSKWGEKLQGELVLTKLVT